MTTAELEQGLETLRNAPADSGPIRLLVCRPAVGERETPAEATIDLSEGFVGDTWRARGSKRTPDGSSNQAAQVTIMNARAAALVSGAEERWKLAGDQIYVDMDLSHANLPAGSRVRLGTAVLEISAHPHTGCAKFVERFGKDAMLFVNSEVGRELRLRGVNTRVIVPGVVRVGDVISKMAGDGGGAGVGAGDG